MSSITDTFMMLRCRGISNKNAAMIAWITFTLVSTFMSAKVKAKLESFPPPCSDTPTVNLLERAVPLVRDLPSGVSVLYDKSSHVHAYKFSHDASDVYLSSSKVFTRCLYFPYEFSLFITLKQSIQPKKEQCVFSLFHEISKDKLISVGIVSDRVIFRYKGKRYRFKMSQGFQDRKWHTFGISMAADTVSFTRDCKKRRRRPLRMSFPDLLPVTNTSFSFGRCKEKHSVLEGLLKSVIFVPGGDAAAKACPAKTPLRPGKAYNSVINTFPGYSPLSSLSTHPVTCEWTDVGTIAFDVYASQLKVCVNGIWRQVRIASDRRQLDYLMPYQTLSTGQVSLDVEVFDMRNEGKFAVFATAGAGPNIPSRSGLFRWEDGKFVLYQSLPTQAAQAWEFFEIKKQFFLAVANYGSDTPANSTIFRWSRVRRKFRPYQQIVTYTARDVEAFTIDGDQYLAVANHAKDGKTEVDSIVYKWSRTDRKFVEYQRLESVGAYDWTYFSVDGYHFLALANAFNGLTTLLFSVLFFWQDKMWVRFQTMETNGATDWEHFTIDNDHFLVVANAFNYGSQNFKDIDSYRTNSTIYKLDRVKRVFNKYQTIPTNSAIDWEYIQIGSDHYLMVSNAQNGGSGSRLRSVLYRWQGMDKFVRVHSLHTLPSADFEVFRDKDQIYMIYANARGEEAQVLKVKFV